MKSYYEYLRDTNKQDNRQSWIDWKVEVYGMERTEAVKASYDPEWGYE